MNLRRFLRWVSIPLFLCMPLFSKGQLSVRDSSISMVMIRPSLALQVPGGDLASRFGVNQSAGMAFTYKFSSGWMLTAEGTFFFGSRITEPGLFKGLTTSEGTIIGVDGLYGDIRVFERGYYTAIGLGKLFPTGKPNPNCGFLVEVQAGFMQHKIKIQDKKNAVPALRGDYVKGYDRLCNGFMARQFIGYMYVGNRRLVNFYAGLEAVQGFTRNRRDWNFSEMGPDQRARLDLLFGARVGWIIALFREAPDPFYTF